MSRIRFQQEIQIDEDRGFLTTQLIAVGPESVEIKRLDYRPIVQEILKIGMRNFKQNCINALYSHFGNQELVAKALGMQRTYISRIINERKRRIEDEESKKGLIEPSSTDGAIDCSTSDSG